MTFGNWHGYAWTFASGGSILPANFGTVEEPPLCANGSVTTGVNNLAMLGVNLNQAETPANAPTMTVVPTLDGITVNVTNNTNAALRVQIQGPNGSEDENDRWCAPLFGSGGFIPWNAFNTRCWNGTGNSYNRQPLVAAMIMVPGVASGSVSFNFCLNDIRETRDPGGPGGGGCSITGGAGEGSGSITGTFDWRGVTRDSRNYVVQNNVWGLPSSNQALSYDGVSFRVTQQSGSLPSNDKPVSYPSVFIGSNNGRTTSGANLPRQVSALQSVPTGWSWSHGNGGSYNAAYDVWFSTGSGGDQGNPSGGYLMVWLYKPGDAQPIGTNRASISMFDATWNVWIGTQLGRPIISYVRTQETGSMSFDLKDFIDDAVDRNVIQSSWYLSNIFAGFEIWSGGVNLRTTNFCAVVN